MASPPWFGPCTPFLNVQPSNGGLQPIRATVGGLFPDLAGVTGGFERSGGLGRLNLCLRALLLAQSPQVPNHSRSGCNRLSFCLLPRLRKNRFDSAWPSPTKAPKPTPISFAFGSDCVVCGGPFTEPGTCYNFRSREGTKRTERRSAIWRLTRQFATVNLGC